MRGKTASPPTANWQFEEEELVRTNSHNHRDLAVFSGSAHLDLARAISEEMGRSLGSSHVVKFSNENLMVQIDENVREKDVFVVQPSCPPVADGIVELLIMIDALRHASARRITAVLPYFPYARSDKKDRPRVSIAARLMADLLETAGASRVLTMDLHSPQIQGFFHIPVDQLIAAPIICDYLQQTRDLKNYVLVAGDIGEAKGVGRYAERLGLPVAIVDKRRYDDTEKPKAVHLIGSVENKHVLIVDDEISTGRTVIEAASFVLDRGAISVEAAAVHGVLSGSAVENLEQSRIKAVIVTDTVPIPEAKRRKLEVLSVASLFARAINAVHEGQSVSHLFR
jgi:ribose-phosphate pyrophosphokinase